MDLGSSPLVLGAWWGEPRCWMVISVGSVLAVEDGISSRTQRFPNILYRI